MNKLRYALIGFGGIAENRIAKEGFGLGGGDGQPCNAQLVGATDCNPEREAAVKALGLRWYGSLQEILAANDIDALFIATSNSTHAQITLDGLLSGKHCIVEKPLATSLDDAEALVCEARKRKLSLAVDHMMVKNAYNSKAASLVQAGTLGNVDAICLHMEFLYGTTPEEIASWRCSKPSELGGPIGDVGSHCFYMAESLLKGKVVELACIYQAKRLGIHVEDGAFISFRMDHGVEGSVRVSFAEQRGGLPGTISNLGYEIYGSKGVLRSFGTLFQLSGHSGEPVKLRLEMETADGVKDIPIERPANIYRAVVEEHASSIINQTPMDGSDGLRNLKLILAAHESAKQCGKIIEIR